MHIKEGFELKNICGENVILATGLQNIDFTQIISLNESAAYLWRSMEGKDFTASDMADALLQEYEVDAEQALKDATMTARKWQEAGLVCE